MSSNGQSNGWKSVQWGMTSAIILGLATGAITMWRQVTQMQEQLQYLLKLNDAQNVMFGTIKDQLHDGQGKIALLIVRDADLKEKLIEHDKIWQDLSTRLRKVEQGQRNDR